MLTTENSPFDAVAASYDNQFTHTLVGAEQRKLSRHWLEKALGGRSHLEILEINCGTGTDALWLASLGHSVIATDQSGAMINRAKEKLLSSDENNVHFVHCNFAELVQKFASDKFDLIFSNFSGLNCVPPGELDDVSEQLHSLLKPNGLLAMVVFGKYSWWETFFYLFKGVPRKAFRRWLNRSLTVKISEYSYQRVYYYSIRRLKNKFLPLKLVDKRPVGLFIPPSYLDKAMQKRPKFFGALAKLETRLTGSKLTSSLADHVFLLFKKQE